MYILALISCILLTADLAVSTVVRNEVPDCVSRCWYVIKYWHYVFLTGAAFILLPALMEVTNQDWQFLAFFTCAGVLFVGAAPSYFEKSQKTVHEVSAIFSAASSIMWLLTSCVECLPFLGIALFGLLDPKRKLLYAELACFYSVYMGVLFIWFRQMM